VYFKAYSRPLNDSLLPKVLKLELKSEKSSYNTAEPRHAQHTARRPAEALNLDLKKL